MLLGKSMKSGNTSMLQWNFLGECAILKHFPQGYCNRVLEMPRNEDK